jgi:hypothetical protein
MLATSARVTRAQGLPGPRHWAHFRLLGLCAGGRDRGSFAFEAEQLSQQLQFYVRYIGALSASGWRLSSPRIALSDFSEGRFLRALEEQVAAPIKKAFPNVKVELDPSRKTGRGYYLNACFKLYVRDGEGNEIEIGDGGDVPWTQKLLSNAKERFIISAVGLERVAHACAPKC